MTDSYKSVAALAGRVLLALMFIMSGFGKLADIQGTAGYVASGGLPFPVVMAALVGIFELVGGIALVIGFKARLAGFLIGAFTLAASFLFHAYWSVPADQQFITQLLFMKNLSVAGGLFLLSALGAGPLSLDAAKNKA
ncbi:MAG TPA: DoxX family protein [Eoetvoesiella sp.]